MLIAQSALPHVCKLDRAFRACIHEPVAALWMKFCSSYDFGQLFHISWLNINNVEALILDIQVPEIYSQVVTADKCLSITVYRDAVDMVCVRIGIGSTRNCRYNCIVMCEAG